MCWTHWDHFTVRPHVPTPDRRGPTLGEGLVACLVVRGIRWIELGQLCGKRPGDACDVAWISLNVRIPQRVNVALGAIETRWLFDHRDQRRRLEIAGLARLHLRIPRLLNHQRQPADFELGTGGDDEIGAARTRDQAGFCLHMMRVLERVGGAVHVHLVAAQLLGECTPFGDGSEDVQSCESGCGPNAERGSE